MHAVDTRLTRRAFGALLAAGAAALAADEPPFGETLEFTRRDVPAKIQPFPMAQVRLLAGPFLEAQQWNQSYMARLDAARQLHNFRVNAGLPSNVAKPFGGWESPANGKRRTELRGHFTGHFLSASAQLAAIGDSRAKAKADEIVDGLAKCQAKLGGGYLSAFPTALFDRLDAGRPPLPWAPFYTIHKILAGLIDMHRLAGNRQALAVAEGMAEWADRWTASKSPEHMQQILEIEFGGMAEALYNLAAATNNDRWAKAGDRFQKRRFIDPLALRRDELRGLHVNTHIPQAIAAARRYEISGDYRFHDVADYFWHEVAGARSYVTEGTSNAEHWIEPPRQLAAELFGHRTSNTAECCCAYNMLKLTRHLYGWTGEPRYFDYYERSLLNHRLGAILPEQGHTQYYLSLVPGAWKTFCTEDNSFWCCTGTGVEEFSKLNDSIYWRDDDGLLVNLFIASELDWPERGFRLRQQTRFPDEQSTALHVTATKPIRLALRVRVPAWLKTAPALKLNGKALDASAAPGGYLNISRTWHNGDRLEMELPMHLTVEALPDDPTIQAILYGPLVLAGDLGTEGLPDALITGPMGPAVERAPIDVPRLRSASIESADRPLTFRAAGQPNGVTLVPLNRIFGKRYAVYWRTTA